AAVQRDELSAAARHILAASKLTPAPSIAAQLDELQHRDGTRKIISGLKARERWHAVEAEGDPLDVPRQLAWVCIDLRQADMRAGRGGLAGRPADPRIAAGMAAIVARLPFRVMAALPLYEEAIALVLRGGGPDEATRLREARELLGELGHAKLRAALERALDT